MTNQEQDQCYSYSRLGRFRCCERKFRTIQAILLLLMVICFIFYLITFCIDVAKFLEDIPLLVAALTIVVVAMIFLVIGIRGVAFESFFMVITFVVAFFFVTIAHGVSFLFRHPGLTAVNFTLALLLFLGAIIYLCYLFRMNRLKPPDYGVSGSDDIGEIKSEDTESSIALTSQQADYDSKRGFGLGRGQLEKVITGVKSNFTDLNRGLSDSVDKEYDQIKRELANVKSGLNDEVEVVKTEYGNLQSNSGENIEKEFVAVKRVLLNETQKDLGDIREGFKREYNKVRIDLDNAKRELGDTVQREYTVVRHEISDDLGRVVDDTKKRYGDVEKELCGSFNSNLGDIEKEFNIFQREFNDSGDQVQKVVSSVRKGFEEFKSGGENVKREIVEIKRDETGNITSYIERRLTDSGVEISSVSVDKGRAPMANFTTS